MSSVAKPSRSSWTSSYVISTSTILQLLPGHSRSSGASGASKSKLNLTWPFLTSRVSAGPVSSSKAVGWPGGICIASPPCPGLSHPNVASISACRNPSTSSASPSPATCLSRQGPQSCRLLHSLGLWWSEGFVRQPTKQDQSNAVVN